MIKRTVFLGETVNASIGFFDDLGDPISPKDASYPTYTVLDINGDFIEGGVGTFNPGDNLYHASFTIPDNALISGTENKYTISWLLVDASEKEYLTSEYFDVIHPSFNEIASKEIQLLALENTDVNLSQPIEYDTTVSVDIIYNNNLVYSNTATKTQDYNGYYIYEITIPKENLSSGRNLILWKYNNIVAHKIINIIPYYILLFITDVRMYLDKVHKDIDLYVGYRDSDLYFYLEQGVHTLNVIYRPTSWTINNFTEFGNLKNLHTTLIYAACYHALTAQYLAEGDSAFDYAGQPVNLSVDRTGYIESIKSQLWDYLNTTFKEYKQQYLNRSQPMHLGVTYPDVNGYQGVFLDQRHRGIPFPPILLR